MALALGLAGLALVTSFVNGLLGAGGAVLFIPLALYVLPLFVGLGLDPHHLSGLVLVQSVGSAAGGWFGHGRHGHVDRRLLWTFGPPLALAGMGGALGSALLPGRVLLLAFAVVTSGAAVLMLFRPRGEFEPHRRHRVLAGVLLVVIALLGGAIGIGAGFLIVPVLLYLVGVPARVAAGTALVMSVFLTAPALVGKVLTGQIIGGPALYMGVAAVVGSVLGSRFSVLVPVARLRLGLAGLVGVLAVRVWVDLI